MSVRLIADVLDSVHDVTSGQKLLLVCMANYANDKNECWPSLATLAKQAGVSSRHVSTMVGELKALGYVQVNEQPGKSNFYTIIVPQPTNHRSPLNHSSSRTTDRGTHELQIVTPTNPSSYEPLKNRKQPLDTSAFDKFWSLYPKHKSKQDAIKAWGQVARDDATVTAIMDALPAHVTQEDWVKEDGRFIPLAATWLRGRRWEDEIKKVRRAWGEGERQV